MITFEPSNTALIGYLNNAIKAKESFTARWDYVVQGGEVLIVDEHTTGRMLHGRRCNEGLHRAEAKEGVKSRRKTRLLQLLRFKTISVCMTSFRA